MNNRVRHYVVTRDINQRNQVGCRPQSFIGPLGCPLIFPRQPSAPQSPTLLRGETFQYTAIADGVRNVYTSGDAVPQFSTSGILDPGTFTFASLFINGILQPPNSYVIQPGILILSDVPVQGAPIIIQFVRIISQ